VKVVRVAAQENPRRQSCFLKPDALFSSGKKKNPGRFELDIPTIEIAVHRINATAV
jgi:hypothetical protein